MVDDTHIAGGIAAKLLLVGIVLAGGAVGAPGLAPVQVPAGGPADGSHAAFPIDNATPGGGTHLLSLDGKGNDPLAAFSTGRVAAAFPSDDVAAARVSVAIPTEPPNAGVYALALGQDMDPYALALDRDMDPY